MKLLKLGILGLLCLSSLLATDYINVALTGGSKYAALTDLQKITFNEAGTEINFILNSGSTDTETLTELTAITFSTTAVGDQSLPVELLSFTARIDNKDVLLVWETASEIENRGFEVQRRTGISDSWRALDFVEGMGNRSELKSYQYRDKAAANLTAEYRLKQVDYDGTWTWYGIATVESGQDLQAGHFQLHGNYPNPFNPATTIFYEMNRESLVSLVIYDIRGREITRLLQQVQPAGHYEVTFDGSGYAGGLYLCRLSSGSDSKIIKLLLIN